MGEKSPGIFVLFAKNEDLNDCSTSYEASASCKEEQDMGSHRVDSRGLGIAGTGLVGIGLGIASAGLVGIRLGIAGTGLVGIGLGIASMREDPRYVREYPGYVRKECKRGPVGGETAVTTWFNDVADE